MEIFRVVSVPVCLGGKWHAALANKDCMHYLLTKGNSTGKYFLWQYCQICFCQMVIE